ncbi:phosphomannomutase [Vibrio sp. Isolate25]|uniref:phosphomannomutase n=1 Tax=Vibrio sp. Isolate25 TaxID=2908535 RepID=UPI001EFD75FB|nr:phosphomannomutase [Vibrio sp. Isolate25]MCG9597813.1 phosphomannomutase [Vibrio sp. Isolate25]
MEEFKMVEKSLLVSRDLIAQSGVAFGTSGARGLVTQFDPQVCAAFAQAFISSIRKGYEFSRVALAIDNRPSSYAMAQACAAALQQLSVDVTYYGVIPTPALAYASQEQKIPAIMVTGSHIPFDRNGLKFYKPDGEISKADEQAILGSTIQFTPISELLELPVCKFAEEQYISRYTSLFKSKWLENKRIGIYEHSSAGRDLYYKIFEAFGAEVVSLERSDEFVPIDTEAVSKADIAKAIGWSNEHNLDLVFSTDGDGDRPLVSDEHGNWLRGDILGLLASQALQIDALSVPVSCNTVIELCNHFAHVERTKIGSPYVIAEFERLASEYKSVAGFEANGGFLLGSNVTVNGNTLKALPTRDAVLPVLMLLVLSQNRSVSKLVSGLPARFTHSDRVQNFATEKSQRIVAMGEAEPQRLIDKLGFKDLTVKYMDVTDGLRLTLSNDCIVHLRPSGNAPELRCYAEASDIRLANDIVNMVLSKVIKFG